jgi:hypothetical protein
VCSAEAVQLTGTTIGGLAQMRAGASAQDAALANAAQANAQADAALRRGRFQEMQMRRQVARAIGTQRAAAAASGIDPGTGTAAEIQVGTERIGELDAQMIRDNAFLEASGYRMAARQQVKAGKAARTEGLLTGAGTLIGGFGTIYAAKEANSPPTLFGAGANGKKKKVTY